MTSGLDPLGVRFQRAMVEPTSLCPEVQVLLFSFPPSKSLAVSTAFESGQEGSLSWAQNFRGTRRLCLPRAHLRPTWSPYSLEYCKPKFPKKCRERRDLEKERPHSGETICKEDKPNTAFCRNWKFIYSTEAKWEAAFKRESSHPTSQLVQINANEVSKFRLF